MQIHYHNEQFSCPYSTFYEEIHILLRHIETFSRLSNAPVQNKLNDYKIPHSIRYNVNSGNGQVSGTVKEDLEEKISGPDIYQKKFHTLLYLEELQMEVDIRQFDMQNAELRKTRNLLSLEVSSNEYYQRLLSVAELRPCCRNC